MINLIISTSQSFLLILILFLHFPRMQAFPFPQGVPSTTPSSQYILDVVVHFTLQSLTPYASSACMPFSYIYTLRQ
uniref:Putative secreted protein n=1 Tax=Ixodes ricinus TaxID=34613 RepID=A0A6B0UB79_IXORI